MAPLTDADILRSLEELCAMAHSDRDGFLTTEEMRIAAGYSRETIRARLNAARRLGRLEMRKFREPGLAGMRIFTAYRITNGVLTP